MSCSYGCHTATLPGYKYIIGSFQAIVTKNIIPWPVEGRKSPHFLKNASNIFSKLPFASLTGAILISSNTVGKMTPSTSLYNLGDYFDPFVRTYVTIASKQMYITECHMCSCDMRHRKMW